MPAMAASCSPTRVLTANTNATPWKPAAFHIFLGGFFSAAP
jgi:hypothetical protein